MVYRISCANKPQELRLRLEATPVYRAAQLELCLARAFRRSPSGALLFQNPGFLGTGTRALPKLTRLDIYNVTAYIIIIKEYPIAI